MIGGPSAEIEGRILKSLIADALKEGAMRVVTRDEAAFWDMGPGIFIGGPDQAFAEELGHMLASTGGLRVTVFTPGANVLWKETKVLIGTYPFKRQKAR